MDFLFELACQLTDEDSSAVSFIGVSNNGRMLTLVGKNNTAYTYSLPDEEAIYPMAFAGILRSSLGRFWSTVKKRWGEALVSKYENFNTDQVSVEKWCKPGDSIPVPKPKTAWEIGGEGQYAF